MKRLDHTIERTLDRLEGNLTFAAVWIGLFAICGLLTLAIKDYEQRMCAQQLRSTHTAGMAVGADVAREASR